MIQGYIGIRYICCCVEVYIHIYVYIYIYIYFHLPIIRGHLGIM